MYIECKPGTCTLGDQCGNRRIQKHEWSSGLEKFTTKDRGSGIRTSKALTAGTCCALIETIKYGCLSAYHRFTSFEQDIVKELLNNIS